MPCSVKLDEFANPVSVGFAGAFGVMFQTNGVYDTFDKLSAGLIEKFFGLLGCGGHWGLKVPK